MADQNYSLEDIEIYDEVREELKIITWSALYLMDLELKYLVKNDDSTVLKEERHKIFRHPDVQDYRIWWGFPYFLGGGGNLISAEVWGRRRVKAYNAARSSKEDPKFEFVSCLDSSEVRIDLT